MARTLAPSNRRGCRARPAWARQPRPEQVSARPGGAQADAALPGGLNGRQVALAAREARPHLPVLRMAGHAGTVLDDGLAPGTKVVGKPSVLDSLAAQVRALLAGAAAWIKAVAALPRVVRGNPQRRPPGNVAGKQCPGKERTCPV